MLPFHNNNIWQPAIRTKKQQRLTSPYKHQLGNLSHFVRNMLHLTHSYTALCPNVPKQRTLAFEYIIGHICTKSIGTLSLVRRPQSSTIKRHSDHSSQGKQNRGNSRVTAARRLLLELHNLQHNTDRRGAVRRRIGQNRGHTIRSHRIRHCSALTNPVSYFVFKQSAEAHKACYRADFAPTTSNVNQFQKERAHQNAGTRARIFLRGGRKSEIGEDVVDDQGNGGETWRREAWRLAGTFESGMTNENYRQHPSIWMTGDAWALNEWMGVDGCVGDGMMYTFECQLWRFPLAGVGCGWNLDEVMWALESVRCCNT